MNNQEFINDLIQDELNNQPVPAILVDKKGKQYTIKPTCNSTTASVTSTKTVKQLKLELKTYIDNYNEFEGGYCNTFINYINQIKAIDDSINENELLVDVLAYFNKKVTKKSA